MLWAIERHLDGRAGACARARRRSPRLLRPELFPFLGLYGLWAWRAEPRLRPLLAGALVLVPLAWILPRLARLGRSAQTARRRPAASPPGACRSREHPWLRALERACTTTPACPWSCSRGGRGGRGAGASAPAVPVLAGGGARRGRALRRDDPGGLQRQSALRAARARPVRGARGRRRGGPRAGGAALAGAVGGAAGRRRSDRRASPRWPLAERLLRLTRRPHGRARRTRLACACSCTATSRAPCTRWAAREAVTSLGFATTNRALQTRLAWELGVPMELTESPTDYRVVFRSSRELLVGRVYMPGRARLPPRRSPASAASGCTGATVSRFPLVERQWSCVGRRRLQGLCREFTPGSTDGRIPRPRVVTR